MRGQKEKKHHVIWSKLVDYNACWMLAIALLFNSKKF